MIIIVCKTIQNLNIRIHYISDNIDFKVRNNFKYMSSKVDD